MSTQTLNAAEAESSIGYRLFEDGKSKSVSDGFIRNTPKNKFFIGGGNSIDIARTQCYISAYR